LRSSDAAQGAPVHPVRPRGQPASIVVGQTQPPATELPAQEAVLFDQVRQRLPRPALQPAGQHQQQHLEGRWVDHERELISQQECFAVHNRSIELWDTTASNVADSDRPRHSSHVAHRLLK
jgi:hypothetical protein